MQIEAKSEQGSSGQTEVLRAAQVLAILEEAEPWEYSEEPRRARICKNSEKQAQKPSERLFSSRAPGEHLHGQEREESEIIWQLRQR